MQSPLESGRNLAGTCRSGDSPECREYQVWTARGSIHCMGTSQPTGVLQADTLKDCSIVEMTSPAHVAEVWRFLSILYSPVSEQVSPLSLRYDLAITRPHWKGGSLDLVSFTSRKLLLQYYPLLKEVTLQWMDPNNYYDLGAGWKAANICLISLENNGMQS